MLRSVIKICLLTFVVHCKAQIVKQVIEDVDPRKVSYVMHGGDSLDRAFSILPLDDKSDLVIGLNFDSGMGDPTISKVSKKDLSIE